MQYDILGSFDCADTTLPSPVESNFGLDKATLRAGAQKTDFVFMSLRKLLRKATLLCSFLHQFLFTWWEKTWKMFFKNML
jgi:hypothetical protein